MRSRDLRRQRRLKLPLLIVLVLAACAAKLERTAPETRPFVEAILSASAEEVADALRRLFNEGSLAAPRPNKFPPGDKLHAFALYPGSPAPGHIAIPPDVDLRAGAREDPAMERYLALGSEKRRNDFFLYHALDAYWPSEYRSGGVPVDFSCDFIFHLEPLGPGRTRLEVLEYRPSVRVGKKLAPSAHGIGLGRVYDIRVVPPTTRDRLELLQKVAAAVRPPP